ncbi:MAG TPA: TIGR04190 family B12-binding domain/radical SAM domain protein [Vicinamibacterales bacterium]|nr:TIGR04190 family B12-binding domain/radical SAM domain protein [Vicinamibacterales bacterium]
MMRNPFRRDLVLLHPPAIYDFRTRETFLGPVADAVPSTTMFEMYPMGLTSIAEFLERNHYNVEIVNLAYRMLHDDRFDVPAHLARLSAPVFGIDLHWLPHAQGGLAIAELVKAAHPDSAVLMGGLSASYYADELIRYPFVDFVIRGDSTEEPVRRLLRALREHEPLADVPNLTWKRADGTIVANALSHVPTDLDHVSVPAYRYLLRSMFKYRSLWNLVPCLEWLRYPITMLLTARGCTQDCAICGGSMSAYRRICGRGAPAYRSADVLAEDVRTIASFSRAPIFVVHDIRMGGMPRARQFLSRLRDVNADNEIVFELYFPGNDSFFREIETSTASWSVEITLESPDEALRKVNGKWPWSNAAVERTIESALAHRCETLDLFFIIGLPHQTYQDALAIGDYCEYLLDRFGSSGRLRPFVAPLGPFLDPGSRGFEDRHLGYERFCLTLDDHRRALLNRDWHDILSYQTDGMTRDDIVRASYAVASHLNELKHRHQLISDATYTGIRDRLELAHTQPARAQTMIDEDEMKWPVHQRFRIGTALLTHLATGLFEEVGHTLARVRGRYDDAA